MPLWSDIERVLRPATADIAWADALAAELASGCPVRTTQTSLARASGGAIAALYTRLEQTTSPASPHSGDPDSTWMSRTDFCWVNVRASAIDITPGSFIQAAKLLPGIAARSILLAPFHPVQFDLVYAPETVTIVDTALADPVLTEAGISPADQLRAFISAARLLGKSVGYELLPYVAQFSRLAMERPELFRWVALDDERLSLAHADPEFPYRTEDRLRDAGVVASIATASREDYGVTTFRKLETDTPQTLIAKDKAYYSAIRLCMDQGLWPVPAHARAGVGIPSFLGYNGQDDFPVFAYRDADGLDVGEDAYGVVAPYAFYDDIPPNKPPVTVVPVNHDAVEYYASVFSLWRDSFGFDFVRFNAVDQLFSDQIDEAGTIPASDRPTAEVVRRAIEVARGGGNTGCGTIASVKTDNLAPYAELGFDLVMGNEAMRRVDAPLINDAFRLYETLASADLGGGAPDGAMHTGKPAGQRASVCFAVDVPEAAAPRLWGAPLASVMGPERMHLRHATARFLSVGSGHRPMFETMGMQDGSIGLYASNIENKGLDWRDDAPFAAGYASIERLYARLRPFLDAAAFGARLVDDDKAWWLIHGENRARLVVVAASLETAHGRAPGTVTIPIDQAWGNLEGQAFRLPDPSGVPGGAGIDAMGHLELTLGYLDFMVVDLTPAFY